MIGCIDTIVVYLGEAPLRNRVDEELGKEVFTFVYYRVACEIRVLTIKGLNWWLSIKDQDYRV